MSVPSEAAETWKHPPSLCKSHLAFAPKTPVRRHCLVNKSEASEKFRDAEAAGSALGKGSQKSNTQSTHRMSASAA